jgi:hypothetical protein
MAAEGQAGQLSSDAMHLLPLIDTIASKLKVEVRVKLVSMLAANKAAAAIVELTATSTS